MKSIRTALTEAGFTPKHTDEEFTRYADAQRYSVILRYDNPKTLDRLRVEKLEVSAPGETVIDVRKLRPFDEKQRIGQLVLHRNNELTLGSRPLNIGGLTLRGSVVRDITTISDSTLDAHLKHTEPEHIVRQLTVFNSVVDRLIIVGSAAGDTVITLEDSHLDHVRLKGSKLYFYHASCQGDERYPQSLTLTQGLSYTRNIIPQRKTGRKVPLYVFADAPSGTVLNLAGGRIHYNTYLTDKGEIYLKLGCWSGTLKDAQTLIEKKAHEWPSYTGPESADDVKVARKRYRRLFKHIEQAMEDLPVTALLEGLTR